MRKLLCLVMVFAMLFALCGCTSKSDLIGTWETKEYSTTDEIRADLEYLEFYNDEISYANFDTYYFVSTVEFTDDLYIETYDEEASAAAIREYLVDFFTRLYNNRSKIESYDGYFDSISSADEFISAYAETFFDYTDSDEMLDDMVAEIMDSYDIPYYSHEYKVDMLAGWIELESELVGSTNHITKVDFKLNGNELTLVFQDNTVIYTKR